MAGVGVGGDHGDDRRRPGAVPRPPLRARLRAGRAQRRRALRVVARGRRRARSPRASTSRPSPTTAACVTSRAFSRPCRHEDLHRRRRQLCVLRPRPGGRRRCRAVVVDRVGAEPAPARGAGARGGRRRGGAAVLLHAFARFVREGVGTPAPVAPTAHLVVGGLYRHVRNPMYVAVVGARRRPGAAAGAVRAAGLRRGCCWRPSSPSCAATRSRRSGSSSGRSTTPTGAAVPGWWPRARPARLPRETS